jgi:protoporphyrinogen oxidase
MSKSTVVILGAGVAGMGAAYALARNGRAVTVVESEPEVGGMAASVHRDERSFPLGYHHILHRDRHLLFFLDRIGALSSVRWRRIRMLFNTGRRSYDLSRLGDFWRFPMGWRDKARFALMMARAFRKREWTDWAGRSAQELVDTWATPGVRQAMFEPLTHIKFGLPCAEVSGAWLGARLHHREGSAPLGYIPGTNWTEVLCQGLADHLVRLGVRLITATRVTGFRVNAQRIVEVQTEAGEAIGADRFISTIPTESLTSLLPEENSPAIREIKYTALTSVICAVPKLRNPDFYWMNLISLERTASGLFLLDSLNPTLGLPGESYVNFVTHTRSRTMPFFAQSSADELRARYLADYHEVFGEAIEPRWLQVNRLPMYSPVFIRDYRNPDVRSARFRNLYFAGNYCTFPSVASTGTALYSGLLAAGAILEAGPSYENVALAADRFRSVLPRSRPEGQS